ncbi:class I SAM-dependent methyltransferase [Elioraea sp.]|uniref:class I SAM-dependent methyltransferase n=1 Tax=Elioraea sp. TaxID=2185103 RepID=UPI003F6EF593
MSTVPEGTMLYRRADPAANRAEWHRYYSPKRSPHQHAQIELLGRTTAQRVLEIGPYLGYVTALLDNAGYAVETLDLGPRQFTRPDVPHHERDLTALDPAALGGFDAVLCCETLEHLPFGTARQVLHGLHDTGAGHLIVSVPWSGLHLWLAVQVAPGWLRTALHLKWPNRFRTYVAEPDPLGHKWEVGYRGTSLAVWEDALAAAGWRVRERVFTAPTRSVMHLCSRADPS